MSESKALAKPKRDPAALSSEYHKARKQLMFWASILFVWELIGIDLDTAKDESGNLGTVIKSLKSRQAVPWALVALVGYFSVKCWLECSSRIFGEGEA